MAQLRWFLHAAIAFLILQVALHLIARVAAPVDARTPVD
jgi:hypothetical protein